MTAEILLVDDNAVQAATRQAVLALHGRTVVVAESPYRALEMLEEPELFSSLGLVITDHCMPDLNGPQFVDLLRRRMPGIPVLVLSRMPRRSMKALMLCSGPSPYFPRNYLPLCTHFSISR